MNIKNCVLIEILYNDFPFLQCFYELQDSSKIHLCLFMFTFYMGIYVRVDLPSSDFTIKWLFTTLKSSEI